MRHREVRLLTTNEIIQKTKNMLMYVELLRNPSLYVFRIKLNPKLLRFKALYMEGSLVRYFRPIDLKRTYNLPHHIYIKLGYADINARRVLKIPMHHNFKGRSADSLCYVYPEAFLPNVLEHIADLFDSHPKTKTKWVNRNGTSML